MPNGIIGLVAGWGLTEANGNTSSELKVLNLPAVDYMTCKNRSDSSFVNYISDDKFCAGRLDGVNVCSGDSGGGFVYSKNFNNREVFYLHGIVSAGKQNKGSCDPYTYALFTNVLHSIDNINTFYLRYQAIH